ncbi:MAG TPA: zf-HC2 domain-containing protein [Gemmatimonadales bacterium]|nr:zf-HC2 domain-containing protein [Gemmatimonadales bacterium]
MRHIPEDELHAYLDQGLSRTQCVEIESHLADCVACRASRDRIAALRDRTTALLARLGPPLRVPPAFESVRRRAAAHASERRRRAQAVVWAASLMLAVGLGWTASSVLAPQGEAPSALAVSPAPAVAPAVAAGPEDSAPVARPPLPAPERLAPAAREATAPAPRATPAPRTVDTGTREDSLRAALLALLDPTPPPALTPVEHRGARAEEFEGMWRTMSWDGAQAEAGRRPAHIDGLPVVKVQVQEGQQGTRPLMVVAQQLSSGQLIQTIEGPAAGVSQLLARRQMSDPDGRQLPGDTSGAAGAADQTMAMQFGDRMLAITGALPSDSLRAMIRRLNAEMRGK